MFDMKMCCFMRSLPQNNNISHIKQPKQLEKHENERKIKRRRKSHSIAIILTVSMDRAFFFSSSSSSSVLFAIKHWFSNRNCCILFAMCYVSCIDLHHNSNFKLCQEIDEDKKWHERWTSFYIGNVLILEFLIRHLNIWWFFVCMFARFCFIVVS